MPDGGPHRPVGPQLERVKSVFATVHDFGTGAEQSDDITVLALRCLGQ